MIVPEKAIAVVFFLLFFCRNFAEIIADVITIIAANINFAASASYVYRNNNYATHIHVSST